MQDKTDKLVTLGTILSVLAGLCVVQLWLVLNSIEEFDEHGRTYAENIEKQLARQDESLRSISGEVRRLQDQRRVADELKTALDQALSRLPQQAQPVFVPMGPQAWAAPQQPAPQGAAQPTAPQPAAPQPQTPAAVEPTAAEPAEQVGEGASHAESLGMDGEKMPGPDPEAVVGGTYISNSEEPSTLNFYTTSEGAVRQIMGYVLEPLFTVSEQDPTKLAPRLAVRWAVEDELTITYELRRGVSWSDGTPFTADDVLFTYQTIMDPAVKSEAHKASFVDVDSVTKVDDYTIRVKFKRPYWKGLYVFGNSILVIPKRWYQDKVRQVAAREGIELAAAEPGAKGFGEAFNKVSDPCVGTGPYVVTEAGWVRGDSLTVDRNPSYWRHKVEPGVYNLERMRWRFIGDHTQAVNQVRQQKIDVLPVKEDEWLDSLRHEKVITDNYRYYNYDHTGLGFNYIAWNCRKFPFDDARVRTAMTHLVDRAGLLRDLWRNNGVVATCPGKPIYPEYNHDLVAHPFDPAKAAQLLREAGFEDLDGDGVLDKEMPDGTVKRFAFKYKIPSGYSEYEKVATRIKEACKRVGIAMEIHPLEWATFVQDLYNQNFDACSLYASFADPWIDNFESYHSSEDKPRGGNLSGLHNDELDRLLEACRREFDREKRIPMYHRIYEILHEQQPLTLLVHGRVSVLLHKRFRNVIVRHSGMKPTYWWVDPKDRKY